MRLSGPFLTLPNMLSLSRIPLSAAASALLLQGRTAAMAAAVAAAVATDWLDGHVARRTGRESDWGRLLDPAADKIGFALFGAALALRGSIPVWLLAVVVLRDLAVAAGGLLLSRRIERMPASSPAGKLSTLLLSAYMVRQAVSPAGGLLLGLDVLGLAALAALAASTAAYAARTATSCV
jgi:phosphatidylglycerophosphate synthase